MSDKILLLGLDGVPASVFNRLYDGGELPHLRAAFEGGLRVCQLVSAFPTDSFTCMPLIFQGSEVADLAPIAQVYYERDAERYRFAWDFMPFLMGKRHLLCGSSALRGPRRTLVVGIEEARDAGVYIPPFYFLLGDFLSPLALRLDTLVFGAVPRLFARFDAIVYWTASCDHSAHKYGYQALVDGLRQFDRKFGALVAALPREMTFVLLSDHGSTPIHTIFDLTATFRRHGYRVVRRLRGDRDIVVCDSLLDYVFVYTAGDPVRVAEVVHQWPEVSLCVFRGADEGAITVANRRGWAEIRARKGRYRYAPLWGDPLGYGLTDALDLSAEEWLVRTIGTSYPYGVVRLWQILQNPACGDLVLSFDDGYCPEWSFTLAGRVKVRAPMVRFIRNHGGMGREQLLTVMLAQGPGIVSETLEYALIEDVFGILQRLFRS